MFPKIVQGYIRDKSLMPRDLLLDVSRLGFSLGSRCTFRSLAVDKVEKKNDQSKIKVLSQKM